MTSLQSSLNTYEILGELGDFSAACSCEMLSAQVELVTVRLTAPRSAPPPRFTIKWARPAIDIHATWTPLAGFNKGLRADWEPAFVTRAASSAPVICLHGQDGGNRLTFAVSETRDLVKLRAGIREETGEVFCKVEFFTEPAPDLASYEVVLRVDLRPDPFYRVLREVAAWWASLPDSVPRRVPETARLPMYSTWYSFHQNLVPEQVEAQCRLARELGCETVIVDDGWQTLNSERGYAYCGDWKPERIPEMRAQVNRIHDLGLKFLLWYAVPFVGTHSEAYARFHDKILAGSWSEDVHILDPRFPEVREYLISLYERALREWDLDGFKLDFVDAFKLDPKDEMTATGGRDLSSVSLAVDRLMSDVADRLGAIKPDIMIEFRQTYIGPLMRKYGNIFRASDCPNDALRNRIKTVDIRLLCGNTATHSDMLMWHSQDTVESAALQVLNILFSVPQLSVLLDRLPQAHLQMCRFWFAFWLRHRDVLLDGELVPEHPELLYPVVTARHETKSIIGLYAPTVLSLPSVPREVYVINATAERTVYLNIPAGDFRAEGCDCQGTRVSEERLSHPGGLIGLDVPRSGLLYLRPAEKSGG